MARILCIETATTNCSVALSVNGSVVVLKEDNSKEYSHAERLHRYIESVLQESKVSMQDLDAVAVSKGPGSYTGLRIGVSAAKGLCYALDVPLISIPTLRSLALQVKAEDGYIVAMLDARRMEVYSCVFTSEFEEIRETRAEILNESIYDSYLEQGNVVFIGSGAEKFATLCDHPNASFVSNASPSAKEMTALAEAKFLENDKENLAYFEPYYLKDFISNSHR
jgi:tRNA threonylcarbamoyladenosine biosynthesis protein TsaB